MPAKRGAARILLPRLPSRRERAPVPFPLGYRRRTEILRCGARSAPRRHTEAASTDANRKTTTCPGTKQAPVVSAVVPDPVSPLPEHDASATSRNSATRAGSASTVHPQTENLDSALWKSNERGGGLLNAAT